MHPMLQRHPYILTSTPGTHGRGVAHNGKSRRLAMRLHLKVQHQDGTEHQAWFSIPCQIGKGGNQDLILTGWKVAKAHAVLFMEAGALYLEDFGSLAGTYLNGRRISRAGPLVAYDQILVGAALIQVLAIDSAVS